MLRKDYFYLETKGEFKKVYSNNTITFKSIVKSVNPNLDGKYLDLKYMTTLYEQRFISVLDYTIKPLFSEFVFTMRQYTKYNSGFSLSTKIRLTRTVILDFYNTEVKYKYTSSLDAIYITHKSGEKQ